MVALVVWAHVVAAEDANKSAAIATLSSVWNERTREKVAILPDIWNPLKAMQWMQIYAL
jgi:hypothetical protein